jgi:hypothetical protein
MLVSNVCIHNTVHLFFWNSYWTVLFIPCISAPKAPRKTRAELYKDVDADYYGYRDEDDGVLVPIEQEVEKEGKWHIIHCISIFILTVTTMHYTRNKAQHMWSHKVIEAQK